MYLAINLPDRFGVPRIGGGDGKDMNDGEKRTDMPTEDVRRPLRVESE